MLCCTTTEQKVLCCSTTEQKVLCCTTTEQKVLCVVPLRSRKCSVLCHCSWWNTSVKHWGLSSDRSCFWFVPRRQTNLADRILSATPVTDTVQARFPISSFPMSLRTRIKWDVCAQSHRRRHSNPSCTVTYQLVVFMSQLTLHATRRFGFCVTQKATLTRYCVTGNRSVCMQWLLCTTCCHGLKVHCFHTFHVRQWTTTASINSNNHFMFLIEVKYVLSEVITNFIHTIYQFRISE